MSKESPFFRVKKEKIMTESGIRIPRRVALTNMKTGTLLGIMSHEYELILNSQVAKLFEDALESYRIKKITDHLDALTRRWKRRIIFEGAEYKYKINDTVVHLGIEVFNGYDARTSFGFELIAYRPEQESCLYLYPRDRYRERYYHFSENPAKLRASIERKFGEFKNILQIWQQWSEIEVTKSNYENWLSNLDFLTAPTVEEFMESYEEIMSKRGWRENKWSLFNVLSYQAVSSKARKGSPIFSNRHKTIERVIECFYVYDIR